MKGLLAVKNPVSKMKGMAFLLLAYVFFVSCSDKQDFIEDNAQLLSEKTVKEYSRVAER